jgi:UDP-glucose 4-epimerase
MKTMITGATGFLGRNLTNYLKDFDNELVLIDRPPHLFDQRVTENWWHGLKILHYDFKEDAHHIEQYVENIDTVFHLANRARIPPSWEEYQDYYETNITATHKFFEICQRKGVKRFIYISSSSVYGNNGSNTQCESDPLMPTNPYAVSKLAAEWALKVQAVKGDTELIIVRPFTMYGKFMDYGKQALVLGQFLNSLETDKPLVLHGGGDQRRDFLHVDDAVVGLKLIMDYGLKNETYNLGSGTSVSIKQLADIVSSKQIVSDDRWGPVSITEANIDKLKALGFMPQQDVVKWLTKQVEEIKLKLTKK